MNDIELYPVDDLNFFLGLTVNKYMCWKNHVGLNRIANKISQTIGIINKLKHILPGNILLKMYNF